jgi:ABC-type phosphate transport system substrate-binding protein
MDAQLDFWHIYATNNLAVVYGNGRMPNDSWDNTTRNWFVGVKQNPRKAAYTESYIAENNDRLTSATDNRDYGGAEPYRKSLRSNQRLNSEE